MLRLATKVAPGYCPEEQLWTNLKNLPLEQVWLQPAKRVRGKQHVFATLLGLVGIRPYFPPTLLGNRTDILNAVEAAHEA
jgi:hypothetical protein